MFSPSAPSAATTLSSENRATDCADAGAGTTRNAKAATLAKNKRSCLRSLVRRGSPERAPTRRPPVRPVEHEPRLCLSDKFQHLMSDLRRHARQRGRERTDDLRVKLAAGAAPQLSQRVAGGTRGAVRACARHRVVGVGDVHDARRAAGCRRRAGRSDTRGRRDARGAARRSECASRETGPTAGSGRPRTGCCLMTSNSAGVSGPGLPRMSSGTPILPMSWSSAPRRRTSRSSGGKHEPAADGDRQHADAVRVAGGVRVARVERRRERPDGAGVRRFGVRFGLGDRGHQRVEGFGERVELAARSAGPDSRAHVARRRHRGERRGQPADRLGQQSRQRHAADQRQGRRRRPR